MKPTMFRPKAYKRPVHSPAIERRAVRGPIIAWGVTYPGPLSLEQFYGRTQDTMASQPRGGYQEPPVSYWDRRERNTRLSRRRKEPAPYGTCRANLTLQLTTGDWHLYGRVIRERAIIARLCVAVRLKDPK
jgi:hypothetical protein